MSLSIGDKLGPYEILAPIGKGGMGEVWKARDTRLDRIVAIKTSKSQFSERFDREARAVAALNHPNICTLHDVGPNYLVMEFVEGAPLKGPLPLDEALRLAHQLTDALEAAHEKHITHRDLKPGNIMLKTDGSIKVLDFGLAKIAAPARTDLPVDNSPTLTMGMTEVGMILGTAAYMAPEQAKGKEVDKRADIWAFGVVLYELVTGSRPFQGTDMSEILASVIKEHPSYEPVPQEIRRLLKKCLEKDPSKRLRDIGDVWELLDTAPAPVAAAAPVVKRSLWPWAVAALAAAGLASLAVLHFREEPPPLVKLEFPPPEKGSIVQAGPPAVSPDGRRVAFCAVVDGKSMLWIRELESLATRPLTGTENGSQPFWAPDSRNLGFSLPGKLMKIDVTGGPAITLTNAPNARGGTWSKDGVIVFAPNTSGVLARVPAAGGTATPITVIDAGRKEDAHRYPWFLPDGRHFLYLARSGNTEQSAIFAGDLEDPKAKTLVLQAASNAVYVSGHLLFGRERTLMAQPFDAAGLTTTGDARPIAEQVDFQSTNSYYYFSASANGVLAYSTGGAGGFLQTSWMDRSGKVVGTIGKPADIQTPRLSPDGKMVATDRLDSTSGNRDIWLHDLARGTEQRLTFEGNNTYPVWSPDSQRIAYSRRPEAKVVVRAANGTGAEEVWETAPTVLEVKLPMDWTRDGGFLLLATGNQNPKTGNDVWSLATTGERKPLALRQTNFMEWHPRVSPDGRWLAYDSNESARNEIYVAGFPALNGKWQISVNGGRFPVWSRDGRELYFFSADGKMMAVPLKSGAEFQPGVPQPLFDVRLGNTNPSYDVSADGRFLIATPLEQAASVPMTVVLNWQQGLK